MLTALSVQNVVLIDTLSLTFDRGLSCFTGETGAGKSILLDSISLVLGARGSPAIVRPGTEKAIISAEFDLISESPCHILLAEQGLETDEGAIRLRRIISKDGKSRAFINDQPVGVGLLKQMGAHLLEISGQFDQHGLLETRTHGTLLDQFGQLGPVRKKVAVAYTQWQHLYEKRVALETSLTTSQTQQDYLKHVVEELSQLNPQPGEEQELANKRSFLMNAEKIMEAIQLSLNLLDGESGAYIQLGQSLRLLEDARQEHLHPALRALESASSEVTDAISSLQSLLMGEEANPQDLSAIDNRLFAIRDLARKHGVAADDLNEKLLDLQTQLDAIEGGEGHLDEARQQEQMAKERYAMAAQNLSAARTKAAVDLDKKINAELPPLKLEKADFITLIEPLEASQWAANGKDKITFTARTNTGMPFGPLHKVASGGELSRFLLAIKVVLSKTSSVPCLVFDEVDAGIGGATADAVGERLSRLATEVQVLVVTHSPQVAAQGTHNYKVSKTEGSAGTCTHVTKIEGAALQEEIARMLSGAKVTDQARDAAASLMAG